MQILHNSTWSSREKWKNSNSCSVGLGFNSDGPEIDDDVVKNDT